MSTFTIALSYAEEKSLRHVAVDPQEWIENMVRERCRVAGDEIVQLEMARMLADPSIEQIPASRDEIIAASAIPSAAERSLPPMSPAPL